MTPLLNLEIYKTKRLLKRLIFITDSIYACQELRERGDTS